MRTRRTGKEALHTRVVRAKRPEDQQEPIDTLLESCYDHALAQLGKLPGVLHVQTISCEQLVVFVLEHGDVDRTKLLEFEYAWDVEIKVRATQGREC